MIANSEIIEDDVFAVVLNISEARGVAKTGAAAATMSNSGCKLCDVVATAMAEEPTRCSGTNGDRGGAAIGNEGTPIGRVGRIATTPCSSTKPEWKPLPAPRFTRLLDTKVLCPKLHQANPPQATQETTTDRVAAIHTSLALRLGHSLLASG